MTQRSGSPSELASAADSMDGQAPPGHAAWPFQLVSVLGSGSTARVYCVRHREDGQELALKVGHDEGAAAHLRLEAEVLSAVQSPHIPELVAVGRVPGDAPGWPPGRPYLAMTLMHGRTLRPSELEPRDRHAVALVVARDVGQALADLDAAGVAHGDVKPDNIRLLADERGEVVRAGLVDLGLSEPANTLVPTGGTRRYLAPEVWRHDAHSDARARDGYALGLVLAEVVVGALAEQDDLVAAVRQASLPAPFASWCHALTAPDPGARPRAAWLAEQARALLPPTEDDPQRQRNVSARIRSAYLGARRADITLAARGERASVEVSGEAGRWLQRAILLLQGARALTEDDAGNASATLINADELTRSRWFLGLVGAPALRWSMGGLRSCSDSELAGALCALALQVPPAAWTFGDLERALTGAHAETAARAANMAGASAIDLAIALSGEGRRAAIAEIERTAGLPSALCRAAAEALRRMGQAGRGLSLLAGDQAKEAHALRADLARRAGDPALAEREAQAAISTGSSAARAAAVLARVAVDRGEPERALELLDGCPASFASAEARALARVVLGERSAAEHEIARAEALADSEEARGRAAGLAGYVAHQAGEVARAARAFTRAAEHAARADTWVEEATYLTGAAAAHVDQGEVALALETSRRASLLWEHLARPHDAARALLARAAAFSLAGARLEALSAANEARERARWLGDARAQAYACWAITDVLSAEAPEARDSARLARSLLEKRNDAVDRLRGLARVLRHAPHDLTPADLGWGDQLAAMESTLTAARLDWWGARCEGWRQLDPELRARAVRQVCNLWPHPAPMSARGPALAAAAVLARELGDGDASRLLTSAQADAARLLVAQAPADLLSSVQSLWWVHGASAIPDSNVSSQQIAEFETLVRALGARDRLRPLLEQILDSLILWTGVERGLLLLVAPDGKLVARAARNLARHDLEGEQKQLSHSLARRAMAQGEPVVAVDATGELPSVHASVHALKLRSVLAIPLCARGETLGVVYLDDRVRRGAFGPRELAWVKLVASLAALAVADARDQILLRRTARRAERAKQALATELSRREAELDVASRELSRRDDLGTRYRYDAIVGKSTAIQALLRVVDRVTAAEVPVLITGESGSGKELIARAIHHNGPRRARPFVSENCAAVPEPLLESTLFGHVRGAFTGADRPRAGWFEIAHGGTLFLDEIGEMSLHMQTRLLRVLEEGEVHPVGGERGRKVDVRVVAATHRDLTEMVRAGKFREDLYYRLHVITLRVPPLRERRDDIPLLVHHFLEKHARDQKPRVSVDAMNRLRRYAWPGNVRQLENEVRRAIVLSDDVIGTADLSLEVQRAEDTREEVTGLHVRPRIDALEIQLVESALAQTRGNQTKAAELLGLSRFGLQKMMKRLRIAPKVN